MSNDTITLLIKLGFEPNNLYKGRYFHPAVKGIDFDFSASGIEGIVKTIWNRAYERGRYDKAKEIKDVLGI